MKCAHCGSIGQIQQQRDGELQCVACSHVVGAPLPVIDMRPIQICPFPGSCDFATRETEGPKSLKHHVEKKHGGTLAKRRLVDRTRWAGR